MGIYFLCDHKSCHLEKMWSSSGNVCGFLQMALAQTSIISGVFCWCIKPIVLLSVVFPFASFLHWIPLLDPMYISYFHVDVTTISIRNASREERVNLAQSLRGSAHDSKKVKLCSRQWDVQWMLFTSWQTRKHRECTGARGPLQPTKAHIS